MDIRNPQYANFPPVIDDSMASDLFATGSGDMLLLGVLSPVSVGNSQLIPITTLCVHFDFRINSPHRFNMNAHT